MSMGHICEGKQNSFVSAAREEDFSRVHDHDALSDARKFGIYLKIFREGVLGQDFIQ